MKEKDVAIIGIACRFPGAEDYNSFYKNLEKGLNFVKKIPKERWNYYNNDYDSDENISKYCGQLEDADLFDNGFFNISPREAMDMDPQQRLLLEESWHCIEDSGVMLRDLQDKRTSVFVGSTANDYNFYVTQNKNEVDKYTCSGNFECILSNRISYMLGLSGKSITLDTACASSLVSIHEAKESIVSGDSDYALACGVCLSYHPWRYLSFSKAHMMSLNGQCKAFSKNADGFVQGEGVGVLLLQQLEDAVRDGNHIYGVIKGSAVNHCGSNHTISAPKVSAQKEVIMKALEDAEVNPEGITYVETHGTGTIIGDPIEVEALTESYRNYTDKKQFCSIGSVKTNIGHLASAAGVASMIKVLLMLKNKTIVKSLFSEEVNPIIDFENSPFYVAQEKKEWKRIGENEPLRAGVSAFGFGGVNCHIIVEEYLEKKVQDTEEKWPEQIFLLSARNQESLKENIKSWKQYLQSAQNKSFSLNDICGTMQTGRKQLEYRLAKVVTSRESLVSFIEDAGKIDTFDKCRNFRWILDLRDAEQISCEVLNGMHSSTLFCKKMEETLLEFFGADFVDDAIKQVFDGTWQESNKHIFQFSVVYAFISALMEEGWNPSVVIARNSITKWVGYCISNVIELRDAAAIILGKKKWEEIKLKEPDRLFIDFDSQKYYRQNEFTEEFLLKLRQEFHTEKPVFKEGMSVEDCVQYYMARYEALLKNQFSFRKDIEEWNDMLKLYQCNVELLMDKAGSENNFIVAAVILESALCKLNRKWKLAENKVILNRCFTEVISYLVDGLISKKDTIELLLSSSADLKAIKNHMNEKQNLKETFKKYNFHNEYYESYINQNKEHTIPLEQLEKMAADHTDEKSAAVVISADTEALLCYMNSYVVSFQTQDSNLLNNMLIHLWLSGVDLDWSMEKQNGDFYKKALPVYCYTKKKFAVWDRNQKESSQSSISPIIDENISDLTVQKFHKKLNGNEFYIAQHVIDGRKTLPFAAYIELAKEAGELSYSKKVTRICNMTVTRPCVYDNTDVDLYIELAFDNKDVRFTIYSCEEEGTRHNHASGFISYEEEPKEIEKIDLEKIRKSLNVQLTREQCYQCFAKMGITYGPGFSGIKKLYEAEDACLAEVELPKEQRENYEAFYLHPSLLDGALQSVIRLAGNKDETAGVVYLPYEIGEIQIYDQLPEKCFIYAKKISNQQDDILIQIYICDEAGRVCAYINHFQAREYKLIHTKQVKEKPVYYYRQVKKTELVGRTALSAEDLKNLVVLNDKEKYNELADIYKALNVHRKISFIKKGDASTVAFETMNKADSISQVIYFAQGNKDSMEEINQVLNLCKSILKMGPDNPVEILYVYNAGKAEGYSFGKAFAGFARTIYMENPLIYMKSIGLNLSGSDAAENEIKALLYELIQKKDSLYFDVLYEGDVQLKRITNKYQEQNEIQTKADVVRENGVYLITGGAGGLGIQFTKYFVKQNKCNVILLGRSKLTSEKEEIVKQLGKSGSRVEYIQTDVTNKEALRDVITKIKDTFGAITGVLHCAGTLKDSYFVNKTADQLKAVIEPKICGAKYLDELTASEPLDFFVLFSSMASVLGSVGQCDYSFANSFLDSFSVERKQKNRVGKSIAINWPLWKDGGMTLNPQYIAKMENKEGLYAISLSEGLKAFETALHIEGNQFIVLKGDKNVFETRFDENRKLSEKIAGEDKTEENNQVFQTAALQLRKMLAKELCTPVEKVSLEESFENFGIDSVMIMDLNQVLEEKFGETSKTLFYEYENLYGIADYMVKKHRNEILGLDENDNKSITEEVEEKKEDIILERFISHKGENVSKIEDEKIAIIGVSGRYPGADDLDAFWNELCEGKDCITEIPSSRWDLKKYYDSRKGEKGKHYSKWGGWLNQIDQFDPLFFRISPREAQLMDPQERLFLETVWQTIEDAGYTKQTMEDCNVGVFAGVMYGTYSLEALEESVKGNEVSVGLSHASIANRISYTLNLKGPSITLDTMCSSSLTTIHLACESILRGECKMAIAGGVNITTHPSKYIFLSQGKFLSSDGRCRSFGADGDGYVPGEGVGAVLLKPLSQAVKDHDNIYGIIKSTTVNHGGRTSGFTVPSPNAQAKLIEDNFRKAGIEPESIGYLEAHGTGTALGDPIEITALTKAFHQDGQRVHSIPIGSVKSNIGHLESAAGIAAVTKVLLQLKYKKLVPSIHADTLNPNIHFEETPFYVQKELEDWKKKSEFADGHVITYPRRACVSAFGAGGSNAHVILEEYIPENSQNTIISEIKERVIRLSAVSKEVLQESVKRLYEYLLKLDENKQDNLLDNIAYTLQTGREVMEEKVYFKAATVEELKTRLKEYMNGERGTGIYDETYSENTELMELLKEQEKMTARRISLPPYPFEKQHYYIEKTGDYNIFKSQETDFLHPLIDYQNESTIFEQIYRKKFKAKEYFVEDHVIAGRHIIPGACIVEMARAAGAMGVKGKIYEIGDVILADSVDVENGTAEVKISIKPVKDYIAFELASYEEESRVYSRANLFYTEKPRIDRILNLEEYRAGCRQHKTKEEVYALFEKAGFQYGRRFTAIEEADCGETEAVSVLKLPDGLKQDFNKYVLHPSLLDAAFGTIMQIHEHSREIEQGVRIPFSIQQIQIYDSIPEECMVYAKLNEKNSEISKYDVVITDMEGRIVVEIHNFSSRLIHKSKKNSSLEKGSHKLYYYKSLYEPMDLETSESQKKGKTLLILGSTVQKEEALTQGFEHIIRVDFNEVFCKRTENSYEINPLDEGSCQALFEELGRIGRLPDYILHAGMIDYEKDIQNRLKKVDLEYAMHVGVLSIVAMVKALTTVDKEQEVRISYAYIINGAAKREWSGLVEGFASSILTMNHNIHLQTVGLENIQDIKKIGTELTSKQRTAAYFNGKRYTQKLKEIEAEYSSTVQMLKPQGVYLITGGLGGLGKILAEYITSQVKAYVILTGRHSLSKADGQFINKLKSAGSTIEYLTFDMADLDAVTEAVQYVEDNYHRIDGVFHCAGTVGKKQALDCSIEQFKKDLSAKVYGIYNLDQAIGSRQLDFMILFSSISGFIGDFGVGSYGAGSRYLDYFAHSRNEKRESGLRKGKTYSVDWPFWAAGGMKLPENQRSLYYEYGGFGELETKDGLQVIEKLIGFNQEQIIVAAGDKDKIDKLLGVKTTENEALDVHKKAEAKLIPPSEEKIFERTQAYLKDILSDIIKLPAGRINPNKEMEAYGIDSVMIMEFNERLEKDFSDLSRTLLFEYQTLHDLACYFCSNHKEELISLFHLSDVISEKKASDEERGQLEVKTLPIESVMEKQEIEKKESVPNNVEDDIAIVGLSGRYPMADNIDELWNNLINGRDCITEIPKSRWDYRKYYDEDSSRPGKIYSKWGGFINHAREFDPMFFNISPKEAQRMDPQERIFLETVWSCIEDAGYSREKLWGNKVGVFVGAMYGHYQMVAKENSDTNIANSFFSSIANRVSYYMNFTGPSLALDTACSSSLEAIRLACRSIQEGSCNAAIAGGVNLSLHPEKYLFLCQNKFLSTDGRCRSFGSGGNGYVPGEGSGAVLLKPLKQAEKDHDHIYGVIKAAVVNHGGKTNGYSVPNPSAQENLIVDAINKAEIDAQSIGYFEAHGTGTELGDPIEINGLVHALNKKHALDSEYSIGSIKSNIGHLESAAGIAAVTKVLLQMKYKKLVPSIHAEQLNENIQFNKIPVHVQRDYEEWNKKVYQKNGITQTAPRRAGISAFGAGGTNVHIILEEYESENMHEVMDGESEIIMLSAKNKKVLKEYAANLKQYLQSVIQNSDLTKPMKEMEQEQITSAVISLLARILEVSEDEIDSETELSELCLEPMQQIEFAEGLTRLYQKELTIQRLSKYKKIVDISQFIWKSNTSKPEKKAVLSCGNDITLRNIAYTLWVGRTALEERAAFVVKSIPELVEKLDAFLKEEQMDQYETNNIKNNLAELDYLDMGDYTKKYIQQLYEQKDYQRIAHLWTLGITVDWEEQKEAYRISLPTYPFEQELCWILRDKKTDDREHDNSSEKSGEVNDEDIILGLLEGVQSGETSIDAMEKVLEVYLSDEDDK